MYSCSPVRPGTVQALIREWQARQDTLEMEAKYYQARAADKSELLHFAEVEHQIFRLENKELTERVNELETQLKEERTAQQALAEKEHELQELAIENRCLNTQVAVVQAEGNIAVNEVEGLLTDNIKLHDENAKLQGETAKLRNEVAQTTKDCITAMNMVENVAGQLELAKKENEHLVVQVQETNAKYIQVDHEKGRALVKVHQMQAQVEMTQEALELEADQAAKLVVTLKAEVAAKADELEALKAQGGAEKEAQQDMQETKNLVESLKSQLAGKSKELDALKDQAGAAKFAQQELKKTYELVKSLREEVASQQEEIRYLESHLTFANVENEEIMDKYSKNLKKLDYYQIYTKSLEKSVKNLQNELEGQTDENHIAQRLEKPKRKRTEDRKPLTQVQAFIAKVTSPLSPKWQKKSEMGKAKDKDERQIIKKAKTTRH